MGRPLTTKKYPLYFFNILDRLKKEPSKPIVIPCENKTEAHNLQLMFLSFRNCAVKENWDKPTQATSGDEIVPAMYPDLNAYTTKRIIGDGKYIVEIWHIDHTPEALRAQAILSQAQ